MGLAEKRGIAQYQEAEFPGVMKKVAEVVGCELQFDVHWDTIAEPQQAARYSELFEKVYFTPLLNALKAIAVDDMGKNALKAGLKKIVIDGSDGSSSNNFSFQDGVLTLQHRPFTNIDDVEERSLGIQKLLEAKL